MLDSVYYYQDTLYQTSTSSNCDVSSLNKEAYSLKTAGSFETHLSSASTYNSSSLSPMTEKNMADGDEDDRESNFYSNCSQDGTDQS